MKQRDTPTDDEILMASAKKPFNDLLQADYLKIIEAEAAGIKEAFEKQKAKSAVHSVLLYMLNHSWPFFFSQEPWDQDKFEQLLVNWMVTCDQPFDEVEKPEFMATMSYGRSPAKFTLPKRDGVRRRVMKLGEEAVEETKAMFSVRSSLILTSTLSYMFLCRPWKAKSVSLSTLGHQPTAMHF